MTDGRPLPAAIMSYGPQRRIPRSCLVQRANPARLSSLTPLPFVVAPTQVESEFPMTALGHLTQSVSKPIDRDESLTFSQALRHTKNFKLSPTSNCLHASRSLGRWRHHRSTADVATTTPPATRHQWPNHRDRLRVKASRPPPFMPGSGDLFSNTSPIG
jgi:hypothetical protein